MSSRGGSPDDPYATIDFAIGRCTANNGDTIFVLPGHVETLASAGDINVDIAGISIIGIGYGASRPLITSSENTGRLLISADGTLLQNLTFRPGITATANAIRIQANVDDISLIDIEGLAGIGTSIEYIDFVRFMGGNARVDIDGMKYETDVGGVGDASSMIQFSGICDRIRIANFVCHGDGGAWVAAIEGASGVSTRFLIENGRVYTDAEPGVQLVSGTTGTIKDVTIFSDLATIDAATVADGCAHFNVLYCETGDEAGTLVKTESADD